MTTMERKVGTIFLSILFQLQSCFKNIELEIPNNKKIHDICFRF